MPDALRLDGNVAIVTGARRGLGRAMTTGQTVFLDGGQTAG